LFELNIGGEGKTTGKLETGAVHTFSKNVNEKNWEAIDEIANNAWTFLQEPKAKDMFENIINVIFDPQGKIPDGQELTFQRATEGYPPNPSNDAEGGRWI
jgi:GTPase SAR1 family protein